jgi:uncharacterized protein YjbI with pentapeptide repeats
MDMRYCKEGIKLHNRIIIILVLILVIGPATGKQDFRVIEAEEILNLIIHNRDIVYNNSIINGDLNICAINLSKNAQGKSVIYSKINIENCLINGMTDLHNTVFKGPFKAANTKFSKYASFNESQFDSFAIFQGSEFMGVNYSNTYFADDASFSRSKFLNASTFNEINISGMAFFSDAQFFGTANFRDANFRWYSFFDNAVFEENSNFEGSEFNNVTFFANSTFLGDSNFNGTHFNEFVHWNSAKFSRTAHFTSANFVGANFGQSHFLENANFQNTFFNESARFYDVRFDKDANFRSTHFKDYFFLYGAYINGNLIVNWDSLEDKLRCDRPVYMKLIKYFREIEDKEAEDNCYYDYRFFRLFGLIEDYNSRDYWDTIVDLFWWISCGFGVRPFNVFVISIILILIFAIIYNRSDVLLLTNSPKNSIKNVTFEEAFFFSASMFFKWLPSKEWSYSGKKLWRYMVLLEVLSGMLLLILFVVTLSHVLVQ